MIKFINKDMIEKSIVFDDKYLILVNGFNPVFKNEPIERVKNIFLIDSSGKVIWRVHSNFDSEQSGIFTNIYEKDGKFKAYRWDGGQYGIDIETGFATPEILLK